MMFHTVPFILEFMPVCALGFFILGRLGGPSWALRWLVAASLFFYAWWNPMHLPLLIGSVLANHTIACKIRSSSRPRLWTTGGICMNLTLLAWFKYTGFLLHIVAPTGQAPDIALPLGISFFTFQQIMFLLDRKRPVVSLLPYAAFVCFFPHLIAGPLVRPAEIIPQLIDPRVVRPSEVNLSAGLLIFLLGLAKKLVLADMFGGFADIGYAAAAHGATLTFFEAWYATLAYALQIYFDFSGYSDMAIGLARMLNIRFPLNFDSPYQAPNIAEFWRRWHITLGVFLRNYLYIPLGGSRCGPVRQSVNVLVTMLLCGLWHGAAWSFVLWGGLHGLFLAIHRVAPPVPRWIGRMLTLFAVVVAWVPFRAVSLPATTAMLSGMAGLNGIALPRMIVSAWPILGEVAEPVSLLPYLGDARTLSFPEVTACLALGWFIVLCLPNLHRMTERARYWTLTAGFALSIQALFFAPNVAPFLYFQF